MGNRNLKRHFELVVDRPKLAVVELTYRLMTEGVGCIPGKSDLVMNVRRSLQLDTYALSKSCPVLLQSWAMTPA